MSNYDPQKPWLARVLLPFWVLQLIATAILIIGSSYAISLVAWYDNYTGKRLFSVSAVILLVFSVVSFALVVAEMAAYSIRRLNPLAYLISNVFKTACWTVYLCLGIVAAAMEYSASDLIISVVYFLIFLGSLIYASVVYHRRRMSTKYNRLSLHNRQPSASFTPDASIPADYYATETSYDAHRDSHPIPDPSELHFYGSDAHGAGPEYHHRMSISMPSIQVTGHPTSQELDLEAQAALHEDYRRSITLARGYEPVRMQLYEMDEGSSSGGPSTAAEHASDVSPLVESHEDNHPASCASSVYSVPVSPLVISKVQPVRSNSLEERMRKNKASMGGLIRLATHTEEK